MVLLPLIQRELGLRSRRGGSYWARFAVGAVAMLASVPILLSSGIYNTPGHAGSTVFDTLVALAFVLCCLTCILSADVIASEKREGTLGLLFLTSVRQFDVILAKLVSSGVAALTALLVLIPFLALPMLAGGVTGGETLRKALALLNTMFLALAVGIYSSSCRPEKFKAARQAALILLALTLFPLLAEYLLWPMTGLGAGWVAGTFSSLLTLIEAGDLHYKSSAGSGWPYWSGIMVVQAIGWIYLSRAGTRMQKMLREEQRPIIRRIEPRSFQPVAFQPAPFNSGRWPTMLPPVQWLVRRQRGLKGILWAGVLAGFVYYVFFRAFFTWRLGMGGIASFAMWVPSILMGTFSGSFFAWAASRFFVEIRRSGELELLITTPVGAKTIAQDQWKVLSDALVLPLTISGFGILLPSMLSTLVRLGSAGGEIVFLAYLLQPITSAANTVVGMLALCRVGLWFGLKARGQAAAILWTLGVVKGIPYLVGFGWSIVTGLFALRSSNLFWPALSLFPAVPTFIFYLWVIRVAKRSVVQELSGNPVSLASIVPFARSRQEAASASEGMRDWRTASYRAERTVRE
jgi:hypothetical protein